MKIVEKIKLKGRQESFQPGMLSIFINPFFFIRRGLYLNIKKSAKTLDGVLLDFGCGRKPYRNLFNVKEYIGVDIEHSGHSHELSDVDVYYNGRTIPFPENYFDSVFCGEVLEHVFEIDNTLAEINRVMKPNGKILITVPFVWNDHEIPFDFGRYSTYGLKYLMEKHGFEVINIDKSTNFIETLFQLWMVYIHESIRTKNRVINSVLNLIFISPFTIVGLFFSKVLPRRNDLYHNSILLAKKINDK